jgi:multiple sugar transport system ATP-binding protein
MEITKLQRNLGVTTIYVTHDQTEAMTMADRIAVMKDGVLQQYDTPMNTYNQPANIFVAGFIGSPAMNLIPGILQDSGLFTNAAEEFSIDLKDYLPSSVSPGPWTLGIRPESIHGDNGLNIHTYYPIQILADIIEPLGSDSYLYFQSGETKMVARLRPETSPGELHQTTLYFDRSKLHFFHPESGIRMNTK